MPDFRAGQAHLSSSCTAPRPRDLSQPHSRRDQSHEVFTVTLTSHRGGPPLQTNPGQVRIRRSSMAWNARSTAGSRDRALGWELARRPSQPEAAAPRGARCVDCVQRGRGMSDPDGERVTGLCAAIALLCAHSWPALAGGPKSSARRAVNLMLVSAATGSQRRTWSRCIPTSRKLAAGWRTRAATPSQRAACSDRHRLTPVCVASGSTTGSPVPSSWCTITPTAAGRQVHRLPDADTCR